MNNLRRFFNKNMRSIIIIILAIVFSIFLIQLLNSFYANTNLEETKELIMDSKVKNSQYSVITKESISTEEGQKLSNVIEDFIKKCNSGNIKQAYDCLSEGCKKELYPTLDKFKEYYNRIFSSEKDYSMKLWYPDIRLYKVEFMDDIMSTGKINNVYAIEEYFSIVIENNEEKLNISGFLGNINIGKNKEENDINVKVNYKQVYLDYEIYNITIKNNTKNTILLDSNERANTICLLDENDTKYSAYKYELNSNQLVLKPYYTQTLNIKFSKRYYTNSKIKSLVFYDVIQDYDEYQTKDKNYNERFSIEVKL